MMIYNIADMLTGVFESTMLFLMFGTFFIKRENMSNWIYVVGVAVLSILINISNNIFENGMLNAVGMSVSFFIVSFLYKGNIPTKAIISVLMFLLIVIVEILVLFGVTLIYGITVAEAVDIPSYRLLGIIISKMLTFLVVDIIRKKYKNSSFLFKPSYWILFVLIFSTSIMAVFLIFKLSYDIADIHMSNLSILCSLGLLFSTFFALYLYEHLSSQAETISNQKQYEQFLKAQLKHLDEILVVQKQLKKFRHDFDNFAIGLEAYIENNDFISAKTYLEGMKQNIHSGKNIVETGNVALDAMLSTKRSIAEGKGISVTSRIQIPENLSIDSMDICIIFGNALDNAIEACEKCKGADKEIDITIAYHKKSLFCKIENTAIPPKSIVYSTTKADKKNHGFGLENIKSTLEKYGAEPDIEYKNGRFILKFVLFIK